MNKTPVSNLLRNCYHLIKASRLYFFLFFIAIIFYWSILNDSFIGDDFWLSSHAGNLSFFELYHLFDELSPKFIRPIPLLVWWMQFNIFGIAGLPSHLINVAIHAGAACILFRLLQKMGASRLASFLASLLFVCYPLAPEVVTWSAGRFDVLALFFILLTMFLYQKYLMERRTLIFAAAMLSAVAALLSKEASLILLVLLPAMELSSRRWSSNKRLEKKESTIGAKDSVVMRLLVLAAIFTAYILLRYAILGGMGGYPNVPLFGKPSFKQAFHSFLTLVSPFNDREFSLMYIYFFGGFFVGLLLLSMVVVFVNRKKQPFIIKYLWLYLFFFLVVSTLPGYALIYMGGVTNNLLYTRFLYIPSLALIAIMVVGLIDFGWRNKRYRITATCVLLALIPIFYWGLNKNNNQWQRASLICDYISSETVNLLPEPPLNARMYFLNIPDWDGAYIYPSGLSPSVRWKYNRSDLKVSYVEPDSDLSKASDGYLFVFNQDLTQLSLARGPEI